MMTFLKKVLKKFLKIQNTSLFDLKYKERKIVSRIRSRNLTYLSDQKLKNIVKTCRRITDNQIPGLFVEAGCALGGSAILISSIKNNDRVFQIYDVFGMIPPPTQQDTNDVHERYEQIRKGNSSGIGGEEYYGYKENLFETVKQNLNDFDIDCEEQNVALIKGLVQETLLIDQKVAFAHIDVDWYEPVKTCLERLVPNLVEGGSIILDDYHDWGGCKKATDEYFKNYKDNFSWDDNAGSLKITRIH